jgi:hypothetical protein
MIRGLSANPGSGLVSGDSREGPFCLPRVSSYILGRQGKAVAFSFVGGLLFDGH